MIKVLKGISWTFIECKNLMSLVSLVEKSEYWLHPLGTNAQSLYKGLAKKSNIHILPQEPLTLSVFYPILATSNANGIKGLRKPSVDIIPSYVDKIFRIKRATRQCKTRVGQSNCGQNTTFIGLQYNISVMIQFLGSNQILN